MAEKSGSWISATKELADYLTKAQEQAKNLGEEMNKLSGMEVVLQGVINAIKDWSALETVAKAFEKLRDTASGAGEKLSAAAIGAAQANDYFALMGEVTEETSGKTGLFSQILGSIPLGGVGVAIGVLTTGIGLLATAQENAKQQAIEFGKAMESVAAQATDFESGISSAGNVMSGFNESIISSNGTQAELAQGVADAQNALLESIQNGCAGYDELKAKMLEAQKAEIDWEASHQDVVLKRAEAAAELGTITEEEAQMLINSAEETKQAVIDKAEEQYSEEMALLIQKYGDQATVNNQNYMEEVEEAQARRDASIAAAEETNTKTLAILQQGYSDKQLLANENLQQVMGINEQLIANEQNYNAEYQRLTDEMNAIQNKDSDEYVSLLNQRTMLSSNYKESQKGLYKDLTAVMDEETKKQMGSLLAMADETIRSGGVVSEETGKLIEGLKIQWNDFPEDTKEELKQAFPAITDVITGEAALMTEETEKELRQGGHEGGTAYDQGLASGMSSEEEATKRKGNQVLANLLSAWKRLLGINSPSKVFAKEMGAPLMAGIGVGWEQESRSTFGKMQRVMDQESRKLSANMVSRARHQMTMSTFATVDAQAVAAAVTGSLKGVNLVPGEGMLHATLNIDGREFAIATTPYVSEELAWRR